MDIKSFVRSACGFSADEAERIRVHLLDQTNASATVKDYTVGSARNCRFMLSENTFLVSLTLGPIDVEHTPLWPPIPGFLRDVHR